MLFVGIAALGTRSERAQAGLVRTLLAVSYSEPDTPGRTRPVTINSEIRLWGYKLEMKFSRCSSQRAGARCSRPVTLGSGRKTIFKLLLYPSMHDSDLTSKNHST